MMEDKKAPMPDRGFFYFSFTILDSPLRPEETSCRIERCVLLRDSE